MKWRPAGGARTPGNPGWPWAMLLPGVLVVAADQVSKQWALGNLRPGAPKHVAGPMNFVLTFNRGAAFSLGAGIAPVIEAVAVVLVVAVLIASGRVARAGAGLALSVGLGLLTGGALSNLGDRLFRHHHGAVVDFIQLVKWWPVFNVADAAITAGAILAGVSLVAWPRPRESS